MTIYAKSPSDEGFENYVPKKSSMEITVDELGIVRTYYLEYKLKQDGPFTGLLCVIENWERCKGT